MKNRDAYLVSYRLGQSPQTGATLFPSPFCGVILIQPVTRHKRDAVGHLTEDGLGRSYIYDGDHRQITFQDQTQTARYSYVGEGRRVKRVSDGQTTVYVYNLSGQLVAEYTDRPQLETGDHYLTTDHLGNTLLVTDSAGVVVSRHDYLPFGQEVDSSLGGRTSLSGYNTSPSCNLRSSRPKTFLSASFTGTLAGLPRSLRDHFQAVSRLSALGWKGVTPSQPSGEA